MSKKTLTIFALIIVLLVSVSLVAAQGQLPGSGWKSGQQIQNVGSANASIVFQAFGQDGPGEVYVLTANGDVARIDPA